MTRSLSALKLRQLQYFLAVAETHNFTRAAERLAVTQPTLSHQIAELEAHLDVALFNRAGKGVRVTQAGALFHDYAQRALKQLEAGFVALAELEGLLRGNLRIGVIQSFSRTQLPPVLGQFLLLYPGVKITVEEMTATAIEAALAAGSLDLGIAFAPALSDDIELEPFLQEELVLVVRRTHRLAGSGPVAMRELNNEAVVMLQQSFSTRRLIDRHFELAGAYPNVLCETNSMHIMLATVAETGLATILPERALERDLANSLVAVRLIDPTPMRTSALLWPRFGFKSLAARTFSDLVRQRLSKAVAV